MTDIDPDFEKKVEDFKGRLTIQERESCPNWLSLVYNAQQQSCCKELIPLLASSGLTTSRVVVRSFVS